MNTLDEQVADIVKSWNDLGNHPTEMHRPILDDDGYKRKITDEERTYLWALNAGKVAFLARIGDELSKRYSKVKTRVVTNDPENWLLGYELVIPYSIIPPRETICLASIGDNDKDLMIKANNPRIRGIIKELSPSFEQEIANLETKPSGLEPLRVYTEPEEISEVYDSGSLTSSRKVEKYLRKHAFR
jgi:hypothetical protein